MEAKLNQLPQITDFEAAYIIAKYAHENELRAGTGKAFYQWILGMLDVLGLSNTAGLPQFLPAPGATLTATDAKQWTFLFPNEDGTAATYNKIGAGTITVPGDSIAIAQFDGTDYNTVRFIKMPKNPLADDYGTSVDEAATQRLVSALRDRVDEVEGGIPEVATDCGESNEKAAAQKLVTSLKNDFESKISLVTNEEFLYAIVDQDGVLLWGKRRDGSTYDCDLSVYQYTDAQVATLSQLISDLSVLVNSINTDYLSKSAVKNETGSSTTNTISQKLFSDFKTWVDNKVSVITNEEFLYAIVDQDNILLWGKRRDGSTYDCDMDIPRKVEVLNTAPAITQVSVVSNNEFLYAIVDQNNILLWGKRRDGTTYDSDTEIPRRVENLESTPAVKNLSIISNNEFLYALVDANNVLLWGKRVDGSTYDFDQTIVNNIADLNDRVAFYDSVASAVNNNEYVYAIVDKDNKLVLGISKDGVTHTRQLYTEKITTDVITTKSLKLTESGMSEFQQDLKNSGFTSGAGDWSDVQDIILPIPRSLAKVNITSTSFPTSKTADIDAVLEYYDRDGNYFKTKIILNAQGSSSMNYIKKNLSIDLLTDDGEERTVKFGDWVPRDSFHIKAYYIDGFVGQCIVSYKHAMQYYNSRPDAVNRPYKKYYSPIDIWNGSGEEMEDLGVEARCMPDGFPVELYHNGAYNGLYVMALSKHRSNYNMDKDITNQVFLDGEIGESELFAGTIDWTKFEVRNPNKLKDINGDDYDSDNPKELSDTHPKSAATKAHIVRLSNALADVNAQATDELKRSKYEEYFDVQEMIDYVIHANVVMNYDGFRKNWLWTTYDGNIWQPNYYDHDSIFSLYWRGIMFDKNFDPATFILGIPTSNPQFSPSTHVLTLYKPQVDARYKELRDMGIISVNNVYSLLEDWVKRIGEDAYKRNFDRWPETPSYRKSYIDEENWELIKGPGSSSTYDDGVTYTAGQEVSYGIDVFLNFKAKKSTQGNPPITQFYSYHPKEGGCFQSVERVRQWLIVRIAKLDDYFNYTI